MENVLTVSQFSFYISKILEAEELLKNISIVGEVSSFSITNDIAYFNIKDNNALLQCVLFGVSSKLNFYPKLGDKVIVKGSPSYYGKAGKLSFNAQMIIPYGIGELYKQFEQMKQKLSALGYFDIEHKKPMPENIKRVGVVTSKSGAVLQDLINVISRRNPSIDIILFPVKVQGINAELEITKGISFFNDYNVDAVIVARGGGSIEDLAPFNTEIVAQAVYNSSKFILSAVGHETDYTIIDYVADLRAATPSVAGELIAKDIFKEYRIFKDNFKRFYYVSKSFFERQKHNLYENTIKIAKNYEVLQKNYKISIQTILEKLTNLYQKNFDSKEKEFNILLNVLEKLNPITILKNGYAKVEKDNKSINSIYDIIENEEYDISLYDGKFKVKALTKLEDKK